MNIHSRRPALRRIRLIVPALALVGLLAGCGAGETAPSSGQAAQAGADAAAPEVFSQSSTGRSRSGSDGSDTGIAKTGGDAEKIAPQNQAIIYTAELTVRATDVTAAADKAKQIAAAAGGRVSEENSSSQGGHDRSVVTLKIPVDRYQAVLDRLGRELGERRSLHQGAQDVTEQVADVESRLKSARSTLDQFRTLLTKANKIGEVLEVEREISNREADLEALEARQKALAAQTSMATITLTLTERVTAKQPKDEPSGFLGGLIAGWHAMATSARIGLLVFGALLPWLIAATVVWLLVRWAVRRLRPGKATRPSPSPAGPTPPAAPPAA